MKIVAQNIWCK